MIPAKEQGRGEPHLEKAVTLSFHPLLSFWAPAFPTILPLTRALKGSFLVMSSSSEDRESISRSILLTFSLGWRVRGQSTHSSLPLSSQSHRGRRVKTPFHFAGVSPTPPHLKLPSKASLPAVGAGWGPQVLPPPPVEVVGRGRCPPPEEQGGMAHRSSGEVEVGTHPPSLRRSPQ